MVFRLKVLLFSTILLCTGEFSNAVKIFREIITNEPCGMNFFRCDNGKCGYYNHRCDGDNDCRDMSDERNCSIHLYNMPFRFESIVKRKLSAEEWLLSQGKTEYVTERWGYYARRMAVAFYLANETYFYPHNQTGRQFAVESVLQLSSRLAMKDLKDVSSTELASFINAFLVSCVDPRDFQGLDLVAELRSRVDIDDYVNPFILIALCNAGENITEKDVAKLEASFSTARRKLWTDIQALAVMALSCASTKNRSLSIDLKSKIDHLKKLQQYNGDFDNLKTTALVMQALISSNSTDDNAHFVASKTMSRLYSSQRSSGSFEDDILKTYFALPVFNYRSLVNISSNHCKLAVKNEEDVLRDWISSAGVKHRIRYSLWLGVDRYLERTTQFAVPANVTFYKIMQVAAKSDQDYKFEYTMKSGKPYIYSISTIEDDPEYGKFWFLYLVKGDGKNTTQTIIHESPVDYIPKGDEHLVMWFRKEPWSMD